MEKEEKENMVIEIKGDLIGDEGFIDQLAEKIKKAVEKRKPEEED